MKLDVQEREKDKALENPGADTLLTKLGGPAGLPYCAFLDSKGALIVNSKSGDGNNIGFPSEPNEVEWFVKMITKAVPKMSEQDLNVIKAALSQKT